MNHAHGGRYEEDLAVQRLPALRYIADISSQSCVKERVRRVSLLVMRKLMISARIL